MLATWKFALKDEDCLIEQESHREEMDRRSNVLGYSRAEQCLKEPSG